MECIHGRDSLAVKADTVETRREQEEFINLEAWADQEVDPEVDRESMYRTNILDNIYIKIN